MTIFAEEIYTKRLFGSSASLFKIADALLTIVPLLIITYVLIKLFSKTFKNILGNIILSIISFL
jgi:POT family proton-dependent oligopeptide transporter